jgi:hypothetical protein
VIDRAAPWNVIRNPNYLPTIGSAPAMRQRHSACTMLGNAIGTGPGQSSLSQPAGRQPEARPALLLSFVNDNNSIMTGTCDGFKSENDGMFERRLFIGRHSWSPR